MKNLPLDPEVPQFDDVITERKITTLKQIFFSLIIYRCLPEIAVIANFNKFYPVSSVFVTIRLSVMQRNKQIPYCAFEQYAEGEAWKIRDKLI